MFNIDDLIVDDGCQMVRGYIATCIDGLNRNEWRIAFCKSVIGEKLARGEEVREAKKLLAQCKRAGKGWQAHLMAYVGLLRCLDAPKDIAGNAGMPALSIGAIADLLDRKTNLRVLEEALGIATRVVLERDGKLDGPELEPLDMLREQIATLLKGIN